MFKKVSKWLRAIVEMRRQSVFLRTQHASESPTELIGTLVDDATQPAALAKQPVFFYHHDYPVMILYQATMLTTEKTPQRVIEKGAGWVIVFDGKIAYQPKVGAWLAQHRPGAVLSEMLKQAKQQCLDTNSTPAYIAVDGYDAALKARLCAYVKQQPAFDLIKKESIETKK
jgi:hypothetical protein